MSANLERARELFSRGLEEHVARHWAEAERLYREALALAPGRPSLAFNLGRLMLDTERDEEAERLFAEVLQASPDDHEAHYNLGVALARQGRHVEALRSHDRAIALKPDFADAHSGRGLALGKLGRHAAALESHATSVALQPDRADFHVRFCGCAMEQVPDAEASVAPRLEQAVLACLAGRNVDYQALAGVAWSFVRERLAPSVAADGFDFPRIHRQRPLALRALCGDRLLLAALARIAVADRATEVLFTGIRARLLRLVSTNDSPAELLETVGPLALALAQQCFLNEYVWDVTERELALAGELERRVEASIAVGPPAAAAIGVLASYRPLGGNATLAGWCRTQADSGVAAVADLVRVQITEPEVETAIARGLKQIGEIHDRTSLEVKAQYEENPYPRWLSVARHEPAPYTTQILREIAPSSPPLKPLTRAPRVLIAGCGTGRHAILYATAYAGARVVAVDLSRASLAYATRKARELEAGNIEFLLGDILELDALGTAFDVISSIGVLHHMADPARGLRCLTGLLAPGGYMMIGLYSELARRDVLELRSLIAREGLSPSPAGIRACRRLARENDRFRGLADEAADFYSTSMVRDLVFHVMEHRFTIPQLAGLLAENGLRFLGFAFQDSRAKALYRTTYPADPAMLELANWDELESRHPWLFRGMYQFWAQKAGGAPG
jgi:SAM-dependent methyltransferase/Tfp pilus assembly protein PilF